MNSVNIQLLGSGNAFAHGGRFNTCFHVRSSNYNFLIDCGASSIVALRKFQVDIGALDAIVISHLHGDHFGGIPFLEVAAAVEKLWNKKVKIIGPTGTEAAVGALRKTLFPEFPDSSCEYIEYKAGVLKFDNVQLTAQKALHSVRTNPHSLRITIDDRAIAFTGDTEWHDGLLDLARGADIFISECSGLDTAPGHMTYKQLLHHKHLIMAKRVVLTHLSDQTLNLKECEFERAFDGQLIEL